MLEQYANMESMEPYRSQPLPDLSVPMSDFKTKHNLAFSFSGLASQVERVIKAQTDSNEAVGALGKVPPGDEKPVVGEALKREISRLFQNAAIRHITDKVKLALSQPELQDVTALVVSGGVASNQNLRTK